MKKSLLLTLIGFTIWSCSNNDDNTNISFLGNWNWISSSGGIAGITETPESTGDERKIEITTDSLKGYINGSLNFKSKITIETNEPREVIVLENGFRIIVDFNDNNLLLIDECVDCFISEYSKE